MNIKTNIMLIGGITLLAVVFFSAATFRHLNGEEPRSSVFLDRETTPTDDGVPEARIQDASPLKQVRKKNLGELLVKATAMPTDNLSIQGLSSTDSLDKRIQSVDALLTKAGVISNMDKKLQGNLGDHELRIAELRARLKALQ